MKKFIILMALSLSPCFIFPSCTSTDEMDSVITSIAGRNVDALNKYSGSLNFTVENEKYTPLMIAVYHSRNEAIKVIIAKKRFFFFRAADLDIQNANEETALMMAVKKGNLEAVRLLLDGGADPNIKTTNNVTALSLAIDAKNDPMIQALKDAKALIFPKRSIFIAAETNDIDYIKNYKGNVNLLKDGGTALMHAAKKGNTDAVKALLKAEADPDTASDGVPDQYTDPYASKGQTALMLAAIEGHADVVKALIDGKADVNLMDAGGYTALSYAAVFGFPDSVKILIDAHTDVNRIGSSDTSATALFHAVAGKNSGQITMQIVKMLLDAKADVNKSAGSSFTPLMAAVSNPEIVKILIAAGADTKVTDRWGKTALMCAADSAEGNAESVKILLKAGADPNTGKDNNGFTALFFAAGTGMGKGSSDAIKALLDAKADLNALDNNSWTVLMRAAEKGNARCVKTLIAAGSDVNAVSANGNTALKIAKSDEVIRLLKEAGAH